jgi:hypothetical protein
MREDRQHRTSWGWIHTALEDYNELQAMTPEEIGGILERGDRICLGLVDLARISGEMNWIAVSWKWNLAAKRFAVYP